MQVTIVNFEIAEPIALEKALERIRRFEGYDEAKIICDQRVSDDAPPYKSPGWLEYVLILRRSNSVTPFIIGMIQRSKSDSFEFHS